MIFSKVSSWKNEEWLPKKASQSYVIRQRNEKYYIVEMIFLSLLSLY